MISKEMKTKYIDGQKLEKGTTQAQLIADYKAGLTGMNKEEIVVHYGNIPFESTALPEIAEKKLNKNVKAAGGWKKVEETSLKAWAEMCIVDGLFHSSSL